MGPEDEASMPGGSTIEGKGKSSIGELKATLQTVLEERGWFGVKGRVGSMLEVED